MFFRSELAEVLTLPIVLLLVLPGGPARAEAADRPNILWITSEDNSPYLGCYGDPLAHTPHLDRLAQQGVRYRNAFANAPVCSTARTTLITGMYACALGAQHHRSSVRIPERLEPYPRLLRAAGYYCTNNSKTDYNIPNLGKLWDESSNQAHYKNRAAGQPFFAIFNLLTSHESQVAPRKGVDVETLRVTPSQVLLPPFHPDTPTIRADWAHYYDRVAAMDRQVGELLAELERGGLAEDTIVFYYADHGGALPRGKRNIHDSGTRVPLIVRVPQRWARFAPVEAGGWVDQPVDFVDIVASTLSIAGVPVPDYYHGRPFLGPQKATPRAFVFLFRGRMDERYDTVRAVRDTDFRYVRNYSPHRPWGQQYSYPFRVLPSMRSWHEEFAAGRCNAVQARYWQPKPAEELYQISADPHEIQNLADDPQHAESLAAMRARLRAEMIATRDAGFIPEAMALSLAGQGAIYDYVQSESYPIERVVEVADKATARDAAALDELTAALDDAHPVIRYWGAVGFLVLREQSAPAKEKLRAKLSDPMVDVRVTAAEALVHLGEAEAALAALASALDGRGPHDALAALNSLDFLQADGKVPLRQVQELLRGRSFKEPASRIANYLLEKG